ncbi:hypothetical protein [Haloprofundus salinisoli]|uniref:hypothetical protein n=1 Tax=Haloprofundus salinisoli TaxID=2876193 RepID=UPI001CCD0C05|nr:hypothetical protein [Haloprofundus salinisoli]
MGVSDTIDNLSQIIERYEAAGGSVHRVDVEVRDSLNDQAVASVEVDVELPLAGSSTNRRNDDTAPEAATLRDDGGVQVEFSPAVVPALEEHTPENVLVDRTEAVVTANGTVLIGFTLGFNVEASPSSSSEDKSKVGGDDSNATSPGSNTESESAPATDIEHILADTRNEDVPPYEDTEYLQCLYDSFDTFTAMADALEMDVASETVRRYMIDAGVHQPTTYDTSDKFESRSEDDRSSTESSETSTTRGEHQYVEAPTVEKEPSLESIGPDETDEGELQKPLIADGIGLPNDVELEELIDAVQSSMTLYDVQRQLGLDQGQTRELLEKLNLLDLVVKRVYGAEKPEHPPSRDEIANRVRGSVAPMH